MKLSDLKGKLPQKALDIIAEEGVDKLRPCQEKAVKKGVFDGKSLLICSPTASGKTLVSEFAIAKTVLEKKSKAVYIVPLKALASEKFREFKRMYGHIMKIALTIGDTDSADSYLTDYDVIICTAEKFDSLIRHHTPWLTQVDLVVVDEIHLMNDPGRGPTLEIILTILRKILPNLQIIGLSATIGNPKDLSDWLKAELVEDSWRPVKLEKGIYLEGNIEFIEKL